MDPLQIVFVIQKNLVIFVNIQAKYGSLSKKMNGNSSRNVEKQGSTSAELPGMITDVLGPWKVSP